MEMLMSILTVIWAAMNSPAGIATVAALLVWGLNKLYAARPEWQKYEGMIIDAVKRAEKAIPDNVASAGLSRFDVALQYIIDVYECRFGKSPSAKVLASLQDGISVVHAELEATDALRSASGLAVSPISGVLWRRYAALIDEAVAYARRLHSGIDNDAAGRRHDAALDYIRQGFVARYGIPLSSEIFEAMKARVMELEAAADADDDGDGEPAATMAGGFVRSPVLALLAGVVLAVAVVVVAGCQIILPGEGSGVAAAVSLISTAPPAEAAAKPGDAEADGGAGRAVAEGSDKGVVYDVAD